MVAQTKYRVTPVLRLGAGALMLNAWDWTVTIEKAITFAIRHTYCGESERLVTLPIKIEHANIIFMKPVTKNKLIEDSMADLIVLGKRYIYSTRMAASIPTPNTIKHELTAKIKILTLLRSSLSLCAEYIEHNIN